jgi:hypothetical protein
VHIDADDFEMAERVAAELEHLYMEAAEPHKSSYASYWTFIERT